jgi:hypothetical protein
VVAVTITCATVADAAGLLTPPTAAALNACGTEGEAAAEPLSPFAPARGSEPDGADRVFGVAVSVVAPDGAFATTGTVTPFDAVAAVPVGDGGGRTVAAVGVVGCAAVGVLVGTGTVGGFGTTAVCGAGVAGTVGTVADGAAVFGTAGTAVDGVACPETASLSGVAPAAVGDFSSVGFVESAGC